MTKTSKLKPWSQEEVTKKVTSIKNGYFESYSTRHLNTISINVTYGKVGNEWRTYTDIIHDTNRLDLITNYLTKARSYLLTNHNTNPIDGVDEAAIYLQIDNRYQEKLAVLQEGLIKVYP